MSLLKNVHHVRFGTKSLWQTCKTLIKGFGFTLHCLFKCGSEINLVLKSNQSVIMLSEIQTLSSVHHPFKYHSEISNWCTKRDGPFDIALEVVDVYEVCERVSRFSGCDNIILEPTTYTDYDGKIVLGVIKSCVGDLLHTIIDSSQYKGLFLPGYTSGQSANDDLKEVLNNNGSNPNSFVKYTDHIAIAGGIGDSDTFMNWYKTVFGMKRIFINIQEDESQGFIVKFKNTGMMLKAVCHRDPTSNSDYRNACKFVFVEPTKDSEPNQVTRFLQANSGPGLQHMGLAIDNIIDVAAICHQNGIKFITAPDVYYEALSQRINLKEFSLDLEKLKATGILVDKELNNEGYQIGSLLQIFTEPLFQKDGFFMELIERRNQSTGFGENNINALWEALEISQTFFRWFYFSLQIQLY